MSVAFYRKLFVQADKTEKKRITFLTYLSTVKNETTKLLGLNLESLVQARPADYFFSGFFASV